MANALPPFPWRYSYQDEAEREGVMVRRPVVAITPVGVDAAPSSVEALVDSGSEHVLAAPWIAIATGADTSRAHRSITLGIGGDNVRVDLIDLTLRLHPPDASDDVYVEWQTEVELVTKWRAPWPMVLGQVGFFDMFTITMSRLSCELAVESSTMYDARFPAGYVSR